MRMHIRSDINRTALSEPWQICVFPNGANRHASKFIYNANTSAARRVEVRTRNSYYTWGELLWKKYFFTDVPELLRSINTYV